MAMIHDQHDMSLQFQSCGKCVGKLFSVCYQLCFVRGQVLNPRNFVCLLQYW